MPYDYEYKTADYSAYYVTHNPIYDYTPGEYYPPMKTGFGWVMANIEMIVLYPSIVVLNLLLFIAIVRSEKIKSDPWRWLIAHTSFVIVVMTVLVFFTRLTRIYQVPSLHSTRLCPFIAFLMLIISNVLMASLVLIAIERFRALHLGKGDEGGMGKRAVILSLSLFWLLVLLLHAIPLAVEPLISGRSLDSFYETAGISVCYILPLLVPTLTKLVFIVWTIITLLTVIIGTAVLACRKSTTPEMKVSIVAPTLSFTVIFFFFYMGPEVVYSMVFPVMAEMVFRYFGEFDILEVLMALSCLSFPIIWLVTWSRNGDISWRNLSSCCYGDDDEKRHLLDRQ